MRARPAILTAGLVALTAGCGPTVVAPTPIAATPAPTVAPSPTPRVDTPAAGWQRLPMANLGLTIDLPASWRPVLDLGAVELRDITRADRDVGDELGRWISTSTRFDAGGDMGLVAVDPASLAVIRIGIILKPDPSLDPVVLGRALFGEAEGVVIASATRQTIAGGDGARLVGDRPDGSRATHHLWYPFVGPSGEWLELGCNVESSKAAGLDATIDAAVASLEARGEPAGHLHVPAPDAPLASALPGSLGGYELQVLTGDRDELEYEGVWDAWREVFGSLYDKLPALRSMLDDVRFGVAFTGATDGTSRIEIYALRAPGISAPEWRPFLDGLPEQGWIPTDETGTTYQDGDDVLGVRGEAIYLLRGTPDLVAAAAAQLLP